MIESEKIRNRQKQKKWKNAQKNQGLERVEFWLEPFEKEFLKETLAKMRKLRET